MLVTHYLKHIRDLERKLKKKAKELRDKEDEVEEVEEKLKEAEEENKELRDLIKTFENRVKAKSPRFSENYSVSKQEGLLFEITEKKKSTGRVKTSIKKRKAKIFKNTYPKGLKKKDCIYLYDRTITRLINSKAKLVCYHIYREMNGSRIGQPEGVFPRVEYGIEVIIALSFLVYELHLSQDQAAQVMNFFTGIEISSSQIDSLFSTLSKNWEKEFETIKDLILLALVVYIDETGWKVSAKNCYTWIFKSLDHTLFLFGESRKEEVLDSILPLNLFEGIAGTDCYSVYCKRFKKAQKCWAHFLRDAIKLMLMYPEKKEYEIFFKKLLEIFREAKKTKQAKLTFIQKEEKVNSYIESMRTLCNKTDTKMNKETLDDVRKFINLQKRLIKNINELFTFVTTEVDATSNTAEQGLRGIAKSRNNYQTSKTKKGATKRSIITSVLASLKQNLKNFSIQSVTEEVQSWVETGESLFERQLKILQVSSP